jgi:lecithin-cholesterol acyltransferase
MRPLGVQSLRRLMVGVVIAGLLLTAFPLGASARPSASSGLTPIVLFPAWHFTRLQVTVKHQRTDPACPSSGTFEDLVFFDPGPPFSQVCRDELLTLRYDAKANKPMRLRFSEQPGVTVRIADYGRTESAPFYEDMYKALEAAGYTRNVNIRVAGYDARLTPDMAGFLGRSKRLIEETYRQNGNRPVHVVGHSNGPIYIQYLLTHTTAAWKAKYIHGFTPLAGNFPGQGVGYALMFV